jgi:hypothetical protein
MQVEKGSLTHEVLISVLGGIFALATVLLAHSHSNWGFLAAFLTFVAWLLPTLWAPRVIASILALAGFIEIFLYPNTLLGIFWVVLALIAILMPNLLN